MNGCLHTVEKVDSIQFSQGVKCEPHFDPIVAVHVEEPHRGAADVAAPENHAAIPPEVLLPVILAGMEQSGEQVAIGIEAANSGILLQVTKRAGEGEVGEVIRAAMPACDKVFDVKTPIRFMLLPQPAILTAMASTFPDALLQQRIDH